MFTEERQAAIIQCLQEKGKVKVKSLSEKISCIRGLYPKRPEDPGKFRKLKRTYGGAIMSQDYPSRETLLTDEIIIWTKEDYSRKGFLDLSKQRDRFSGYFHN